MTEYRQIDTLKISDQRKIILSSRNCRKNNIQFNFKNHSTQDTTTRKEIPEMTRQMEDSIKFQSREKSSSVQEITKTTRFSSIRVKIHQKRELKSPNTRHNKNSRNYKIKKSPEQQEPIKNK